MYVLHYCNFLLLDTSDTFNLNLNLEWLMHYHNYSSSLNNETLIKNEEKSAKIVHEYPVPIYEDSKNVDLDENNKWQHYERYESANYIKPQDIKPIVFEPLNTFVENLPYSIVFISDEREPYREKRSAEWQKEPFSEIKFDLSKTWEEIDKKLKLKKQNFMQNARTVFQPFSLATPPSTSSIQSEEYSIESREYVDSKIASEESRNSEEPKKYLSTPPQVDTLYVIHDSKEISTTEEIVYSNLNSTNLPLFTPSLEKKLLFTPTTENYYSLEGRQMPIVPGDYETLYDLPFITRGFQIFENDMVQGISLAEALEKKKESRKEIFLNSRVVGGSSEVRLPTGPDHSKPGINALETLKTSQQLSFTPSAASQFIFPYQMCLFPSPNFGPKPSIRKAQARTLPLAPSIFRPITSNKDDSVKHTNDYPSQQNYLSFSINNYANVPQNQQSHFPPSAASVFNFPPQHQFSNTFAPPANTQPIFCTYLQPPLFQFPTVPGSADFSRSKCTNCQDDNFYQVPSTRKAFLPPG